MAGNELGEFLRARRARLRPEDVGLRESGQRRVAGLRREEIAVLAGVSADYYTRLEQGRERNPSAQVLDALSRALDLADDAREHLYRLAGAGPGTGRTRGRERVGPALLQLMDTFTTCPAFVVNRTLDVLALNALAQALFSPFDRADNLLRMIFVDPAGRSFYVAWHQAAEAAVANLRVAGGHDPHDPRLAELVARLREHSDEFSALWAAHDVRGKTREAKELLHPEVGPLSLTYQAFDVRDAPGQELIVYQAEPGSPSEQALALLGTLAATRRATAVAAPRNPPRTPPR
ncbi:helix-turn-helix transcriptional regulator [Prauserella endophytica]|uniref:Helix-turn-helix domain-containing protein n=1 Tax=Prauserella endophytica TaxID=1592324 RepID=A0ABY2S6H3_9PSEU|nr:helix-turn-helix transcriptional regulator [Prauserella endophytica]TKG71071.1 helix-turn-helix domain-containing protein [Prauserella endophytica]